MDKEILKYWGFDNKAVIEEEDIQYATEREIHIWTINKKYILKSSSNKQEVINNILVAKLLNKAMIPTQKVIDTLDGQGYKKVNERYYSVVEKIEGTVLKDYFEGDFISRASYIGEILAKLHIGLKSITKEAKEKINLIDNNLMNELSGQVKNELDNYSSHTDISGEKFKDFHQCIEEVETNFPEIYKKLPRQVIHRDFQGENLIFKDDKLVGYIDFDLSQINVRLFDICYILTGSLASVFDKVETRGKWPPFAIEIINGYQNITKLSDDEIEGIKYMVYSIEMIMVAYFVKDGYRDIADCNIEMVNYLRNLWENEDFLKYIKGEILYENRLQ